MRESKVNQIEAAEVLGRFHEFPTKKNILVYNFKLWLEGYCITSADQGFWNQVNEQVKKLVENDTYRPKYQKRIKQLAVQAFANCGAAQFYITRKVFVNTVFETLTPSQIDQLNDLLVSQLEESQKDFDVNYYNPHLQLLSQRSHEKLKDRDMASNVYRIS